MNRPALPQRLAMLAAVALTLLSACGGGGGGDASTVPATPVAITADNAAGAAGVVLGNLLSTYDSGYRGGSIALGVAGGTQRRFSLLSLARTQLAWLSKATVRPATVVGVAVSPQEIPCDNSGGLIRLTFRDVDDDGRVTPGDGFIILFLDCFDALQRHTTDGGISLTIDRLTGQPATDPAWRADLTVTLEGLTISDDSGSTSFRGDFSLLLTTANGIFFEGAITGNSLAISDHGASEILSAYDIAFTTDEASLGAAYTIDANGTVASTRLDGSVQFQTLDTLAGVEPEPPRSGILLIRGAHGTSVTLTPLDNTTVRLEIDADGNGSSELSVDKKWTQIY